MNACEPHRDLVERVLEGQPTDADLMAYAEAIPDCPDCQKALMVGNGLHPKVLAQGGSIPAEVAWDRTVNDRGMERLAEQLEQTRPPRRVPIVAVAAAIALAAMALLSLRPTAEVPEPTPAAPPPPVVAEVAPTPTPPPAAVPVTEPKRVAPTPVAPVNTDAVADADDWEPPTWQDLRSGTPKGIEPAKTVDLLNVEGTPSVGTTWPLTVVASAHTPVTICVDGPETGVVWRGHVPAGRTPLTQAGSPAAFGFAKPGVHRFTVSLTDDPSCTDPVLLRTIQVLD